MPDSDANDDLRLPGAGQGGTPEPSDRSELGGTAAGRGLRPLIVRRARQPRTGHACAQLGRGVTHSAISALTRRRRAARSACRWGGRAFLVEAPSRRARRLWAMCHGQPPGSRS